MVLQENRLTSENDVTVGKSTIALELCEKAKRLQESGDYESARKSLESIWSVIAQEPDVQGLDRMAQAEVWLRVGSVAGWIGDSKTIEGAQEFAKNLLSRSLMIFEQIGESAKSVEARVELGICYWHEGALNEARTIFEDARRAANGVTPEQELRALIHIGIVELLANRLHDAWWAMQKAEALYDVVTGPGARGKFHSTRAMILRRLFESEKKEEYSERAFLEYTAAVICFEECGHTRHLARTENNLGFMLYKLNRFDEAMVHLDRARRVFYELKDTSLVAQVNETSARVLNARGKYAEASRLASSAVLVFEKGDDKYLLCEALTTQAIAYARMNHKASARRSLERAVEVAETSGDIAGAGIAYLTILEELFSELSHRERASFYLRADELLERNQDAGLLSRLRRQAREFVQLMESSTDGERSLDVMLAGGDFDSEVMRYEAELIRLALEEGKGSVTTAARLLGITHQRLCAAIETRHSALKTSRAPKQRRFRSIITKPQPNKR